MTQDIPKKIWAGNSTGMNVWSKDLEFFGPAYILKSIADELADLLERSQIVTSDLILGHNDGSALVLADEIRTTLNSYRGIQGPPEENE